MIGVVEKRRGKKKDQKGTRYGDYIQGIGCVCVHIKSSPLHLVLQSFKYGYPSN